MGILTSDIPPNFADLSGQVEWIWLIRLRHAAAPRRPPLRHARRANAQAVTATLIIED